MSITLSTMLYDCARYYTPKHCLSVIVRLNAHCLYKNHVSTLCFLVDIDKHS